MASETKTMRRNTYVHTFAATCPADGELIVYRLEIQVDRMLMVEHIRTATALMRTGYHEAFADALFDRFGGEQRLIATHQGVQIVTERWAA